MFRHDFEPLTFRLSCWPWGGVSYRKYFRSSSYNIHMPELIDHIELQLSKPQFFQQRAVFSLVNVYSSFTNRSYGIVAPPKHLTAGPVSFTFARRNRLSPMIPKLSHRLNMYTAMWGYTPADHNDYVTVTIPLNMAMRSRLNNTLRPQMEMMFKVIGAISKNVVSKHKVLTGSNDMKHTKLMYRRIPQTLQRYARADWCYSKEFWELCPNYLKPHQTLDYLEYFHLYLSEYYREGGKVLKPFFDYMYATYRKGIMDLAQDRDTPESELVYKLRPDDYKQALNIEKITDDLCRGIVC